MAQDNVVLINSTDEFDEELNINFKKILMVLWSRKNLIIRVFSCVLLFFIILTFILPKKYVVSTDLYINKLNNSNIMDINPYVLNESSGSLVSMGSDKTMNNEMELMKSSLVLDKVIRDNDIKYKKGDRKGEYISAKDFYGKGKTLKIENIKGTSVITVSYKSKSPEFAYNVIDSFIKNYIDLHKELNTMKAQKDKALIESEYVEAKADLESKISQSKGLPVEMLSGNNKIAPMYRYSKAASNAIDSMRNQYLAGSESKIGIEKDTEKIKRLASKLEWADMVEQLSDSSKVIVINEPRKLLKSENASPKLLINIILGCVFGFIISLINVIVCEFKDKLLSFSMLSENIVYDGFKNLNKLKLDILSKNQNKILMILLEKVSDDILNSFSDLSNLEIIYPTVSKEFIEKIKNTDDMIIVSKVGKTNSETYKEIKELINNQKKNILYDIII